MKNPQDNPSDRDTFLSECERRPADLSKVAGLTPLGLLLGKGSPALEVALYSAKQRPKRDDIRKLWKDRWNGRATSVLIVALYDGRAAICGYTSIDSEPPPAHFDLDSAHAERLCGTALDMPDHRSVDRFLREQLPEAESPIFGIRNQGLLATHVIQRGAQEFPTETWKDALASSRKLQGHSDRKLLGGLGFQIEAMHGAASLLVAKGSKVALAIFLDQNESAEISSARYGGQPPISFALNLAQREKLEWVIVTRGSELRLYPTSTGKGVGRRGLTDTYVQINPPLLADDRLPLLWLLFSADSLSEGLQSLLEKSGRYAKEIGDRLRDRIYTLVIPELAKEIVKARNLRKPKPEDLDLTYQMAMLVLFRLLFIAYAEDHDLLPYKVNDAYRRRSLTERAREIMRTVLESRGFDAGTSQWDEVVLLWDAVRAGNIEWGVPAYDGGLFENDPASHKAGSELAKIKLANREFAVILKNLLLDPETPEGLGPVDFRSLGVREFGTIYEGLLENELSVAESALVTNKKGDYQPAEDPKTALVAKGEIYLHTRSGARKATGSYYTKEFAVEHLLDHSLEKALDEHLERIEKLIKTDRPKAATQLFEFYVADISMGSGHFLINAIDRIEGRFLRFLADNDLPGVTAELEKLRANARETLGAACDERWLENNKLLRRLIARRCIYGVDLNRLAVELARLSVWIHTFVPGLPLSFLDHNLVCGNSLVGIATFDEAIGEVTSKGHTMDLFEDPAKRLLGAVKDEIRGLRESSDADIADVEKARVIHDRMQKKLSGQRAFFDILTAARLEKGIVESTRSGFAGMLADLTNLDNIFGATLHRKAQEVLKALPPFHFPIAFPEVFLRDTPGFEVIIGNPPWEEATVEEYAFWARHFPGLRGMKQSDQKILKEKYRKDRPDLARLLEKEIQVAELLRRVLTTGPYPGMGTGDADLYKAFSWRFWRLIREDCGRMGVVLPRSAWFAKGSEEFRYVVLREGMAEDLTYLVNNRQWVFPEVHPQYTVVLTSLRSARSATKREIGIRGPYRNLESFNSGRTNHPVTLASSDVLNWTESASLPLLPTEHSAEIFLQLRKAPRLDAEAGDWSCRPYSELHATNDKHLMALTKAAPKGYWAVYKGESFDLWTPDTGKYYAWADPVKICAHLQDKRVRGFKMGNRSVWSEFPKDWIKDPTTLPCLHPRVAFRQVSRATDTRTLRCALLPPGVIVPNFAPTLLWRRGSSKDVAFLIGVLCSLPLDWYVRTMVEVNMSFYVFNAFPVPRPSHSNPLWSRSVELTGRLACPDNRFAGWAKEVGVKCGPLKDDEKDDMIAELDAVVAHLYGLSEKQLRHIFETFHEGWDYEERMRATLGHFAEWKKRKE